jgi:hypothetical protein
MGGGGGSAGCARIGAEAAIHRIYFFHIVYATLHLKVLMPIKNTISFSDGCQAYFFTIFQKMNRSALLKAHPLDVVLAKPAGANRNAHAVFSALFSVRKKAAPSP